MPVALLLPRVEARLGGGLERFAGTIAPHDLDTTSAAIEAACEQVNLDEW